MRFSKILSIVLIACTILTLAACGKDLPTASTEDVSSEPAVKEVVLNRLTGLPLENEDAAKSKPVAIMINNIKVAQSVQSGLENADIIFETEVEGGITRMMAVFADVTSIKGNIGTVRSARVVYPNIAAGLGAIYFHAGKDKVYCGPEMVRIGIESLDLLNGYSKRIKNGLSSEHTLYTNAEYLQKAIKDNKFSGATKTEPFANFTKDDETVTPAGGSAINVSVPFSSSYVTKFTYNAESGKYEKQKPASACAETYKNLLILKTPMSHYSNGKHRNISLEGGSGYYVSNGAVEEIKWTKGDAHEAFVFTKADGTTLTINAGNSYVGILKDTATPSFSE